MAVTVEITGGIILGLLIGSFLNVVVYRLPVMMERSWRAQAREMLDIAKDTGEDEPFNLLVPRSRCQTCGALVTAWQNVPVISWMMLGGRCASCRAPISARYPLVELITGALSGLTVWRFGVGFEALAALFFVWSLIALTLIDLDHQLLPDNLTLTLLWAGLALSLWHDPSAELPFPDTQSAVVGAMAGYLVLWSVYWLFKLTTGKEGMGYGDFKLLGALGAWLGWQMLPLIILLSALVGAVVGVGMILLRGHDRQIPIPFGPYLAGAGLIALFQGQAIMEAYLSFSGF